MMHRPGTYRCNGSTRIKVRHYLICGLFFITAAMTPSAASSQVTDTIRSLVRAVGTDIPEKTKLNYLYKICAAYWYVNLDSAFHYGRMGLSMVNEEVDPLDVGKLYFTLGNAWNTQGNLDSSLSYFHRAQRLFREHSANRLYYRSLEQIGNTFRQIGEYDTARILIRDALAFYRESNDTLQISSALFNLGTTWLEQNRYTRALQYYLEAISFDSITRDTSTMALNSLGVGNVYLNLNSLFKEINPDKSAAYLKQSIYYFHRSYSLFSKIGHSMGTCYAIMNLQAAFLNSGMVGQADSLSRVAAPCRDGHYSSLTMEFLYHDAAIAASKGQPKRAIRMLDTVAGMRSQVHLLNDYYEAMMLRATLLYQTGYPDQAVAQMMEVIDWASEHHVYQLAYPAMKTLASWHTTHQEDPGTACRLLMQAQAYKDTLYKEVSNELFDEVEVRNEKRKLADQLAVMQSENELMHLRNLMIVLILGAVILLSLGAMLILMLRRRQLLANQQTANEKILRMEQETLYHHSEVERLELERTLHREEAERLQLSLQLKEQELVFQSLRQTDMKQLILSVKEKLGPFQYRLPRKKDQEEFYTLMHEISRDASRDPMDEFEALFRQMHGGFFEKLLEKCPDLTQSELRTCALLRLNLPTKDIARLLNLSSASVDTTRHHIRKKLNLEPKDTLTSYLIMV